MFKLINTITLPIKQYHEGITFIQKNPIKSVNVYASYEPGYNALIRFENGTAVTVAWDSERMLSARCSCGRNISDLSFADDFGYYFCKHISAAVLLCRHGISDSLRQFNDVQSSKGFTEAERVLNDIILPRLEDGNMDPFVLSYAVAGLFTYTDIFCKTLALSKTAQQRIIDYCNSNPYAVLDLYFIIRLYDKDLAIELFCEAIKKIITSTREPQVYKLIYHKLEQVVMHDGIDPFVDTMRQLIAKHSSSEVFRAYLCNKKVYIAAMHSIHSYSVKY